MPTYSYKAVDRNGKNLKGLLETDSERMAIDILKTRGLIPLSLAQTNKKAPSRTSASLGASSNTSANAALNANTSSNISSNIFTQGQGKFSVKNILETLQSINIGSKGVSSLTISATIRQFATLIRAGLPLDNVLMYLCEQCDNPLLKQCLSQIRDNIRVGKSLADSMAEFPEYFSQTFVTMVRAGEESGSLELVIERYAEHMEQQVTLRRKVQSALAYPVFMLVIGTAIIIFLLMYVIPQVTGIFADMGKALPLPTRILLAVSDYFRAYWWLLALVFASFAVLFLKFKHSAKGKMLWDKLLLKLPVFSQVYQYILIGQFTRTLGMLLNNGVTLLKSLIIVQSIADNVLLNNAIQAMIAGVQEGHDISRYMDNKKLFPSIAQNMVVAGEKSGNLSAMLLWVADDCDNTVASKIQVMTSLLEPMMILILGAFVGFVVIAIMLPIFEMSSLAG